MGRRVVGREILVVGKADNPEAVGAEECFLLAAEEYRNFVKLEHLVAGQELDEAQFRLDAEE